MTYRLPASVYFSRAELEALADFLSAILNDPDTLDSSGLSTNQKRAVQRAHDKLMKERAQ